MNRKKALCALLLSLFMLSLVGNIAPNISANPQSVYYHDDGTNIDIHSPELDIRIAKNWSPWLQAGRITSIKYKGGSNIVSDISNFGSIEVWNPQNGTTRNKSPSNLDLTKATGNNTGKLTLALKATSLIDFDTGDNSLNITTILKYTMYADFNAIFTYVTIDSSVTDWLATSVTYAEQLAFVPFTSYYATGLSYMGSPITGSLTKSGSYPINGDTAHNIITINNSTNNVGVTLFPTKITSTAGSLRDSAAYTLPAIAFVRPRTFDGSWVDYGNYMKNLTYGVGILMHDADTPPFILTPWIMPNAVPYGIIHSYDEIPVDGAEYNKTSPSPNTPLTSAWFDWLNENPQRRVDIMLTLNHKSDDYPKSESGVDGSWMWNGSIPLTSTSSDYKTWLQGLENRRIGFGIHAYHHDSPWEWEFSAVTNNTWISETWERLYSDFLTLGLTNNTLSYFKPPGFRLRGQTLDVISSHGVKILQLGGSYDSPPLYNVFADSNDNKVLGVTHSVIPVDDIFDGKDVSSVYGWVAGNITQFGLVLMHGHLKNLQPKYVDINNMFSQIESHLGDDLDYFLVHEIADYWHDVLLPLEYTYNTTTIETSTTDGRLTFKLLNAPYTINSGLVYTAASFMLYAPNKNTATLKFTRLSGFATLSNISESTDKVSFTVSAPTETTSTTRIQVGQRGLPIQVQGADSWSYDSVIQTLTIRIKHTGQKEISVYWRETTNIPPTTKVNLAGISELSDWFKSDVTVTLSAVDDISGVARTEYSFDNATYLTYSSPFVVSSEGTTIIYFKSTDKAGNIEKVKSETVKIDKTKPTADAGSNRTIYEKTSVEFDGSSSSDNLGIVAYEWSFGDGATGTGIRATHEYFFPGTHTVTLTVKDGAGNIATSSITVIVLPSEGPRSGARPLQMWIVGLAIGAAIIVTVTILLRKRKLKLRQH